MHRYVDHMSGSYYARRQLHHVTRLHAGLVPDTVISVSVSRDVSSDLYYVTLTASRGRDQACKCHLVRLTLLCFSHVAVPNATRPLVYQLHTVRYLAKRNN